MNRVAAFQTLSGLWWIAGYGNTVLLRQMPDQETAEEVARLTNERMDSWSSS